MRIICEHVSKDFIYRNNKLRVLDDISVETEEHDFICIFGPNGCGKTTLLKIMARILAPSSGNLRYEGSTNHSIPTSLIFQEQGLFPWLNVIDNICFNLEMKGLSKKDRYKRAEQYTEQMDLDRFIGYYPHQLSTGMKQKATLIRGLLTDSPVLLIDEAYASLDIYTKLIIQEDIYKVWNEYKRTIIYVTHDIEGALHAAKHIWIMGKSPARIIKIFDMASVHSINPEEKELNLRLIDIKDEITSIIKKEAQKMTL